MFVFIFLLFYLVLGILFDLGVWSLDKLKFKKNLRLTLKTLFVLIAIAGSIFLCFWLIMILWAMASGGFF